MTLESQSRGDDPSKVPARANPSASSNSSKGQRTDGRTELGFFDPISDEKQAEETAKVTKEAKGVVETQKLLSFKSPVELMHYEAPEGSVLVGDHHICVGSVFVIGGAPGVGKSRAATSLAVAGATGKKWFGMEVHRRFKTMILQTENGELRLKGEYGDLNCSELEDYIRVSPPPPFGIRMDDKNFREALKKEIDAFKPDILLIDPWNALTRDSMEKDYQEAFDNLRKVISVGSKSPVIGIIAHTRKPRIGEKASGRSLLNLLAGSYVLASVPRAVFVIQPASDDTEDERVVFTPCKNNDGELGKRSAWKRKNGLFEEVAEFNWSKFDGDSGNGGPKEKAVTKDHIRELFDFGRKTWKLADAVERLQNLAGCGRTKAYDSLKTNGEFKDLVDKDEHGILRIRPTQTGFYQDELLSREGLSHP